MIIKTDKKEYVGQCNALTYIFHNRLFKKNIIEELIELRECFVRLNKEEPIEQELENIYDILTRIMYTLIYTNNSNIGFEDFKKELDNETILNETINEIIDLLVMNFTDEEVSRELEKVNNNVNAKKSIFPEHEFLLTCLQLKLRVQDLRILTYIDVMKMFVLFLNLEKKENKDNYREATQLDIDRFLM